MEALSAFSRNYLAEIMLTILILSKSKQTPIKREDKINIVLCVEKIFPFKSRLVL